MSSEKLKTLKTLFIERIYRVPEYQRGYSWTKQQLAEFWDDLINIKNSPHYTGVLTLKEIDTDNIVPGDNEYKLVHSNDYTVFDVVDGQQRLTTSIILITSIIEFANENNFKKINNAIYFSDDPNSDITKLIHQYLYQKSITNLNKREYLFLYKSDIYSAEYFKHFIMNETNATDLKETFYTNNLKIAKQFFKDKLSEIYGESKNEEAIKKLFNNLTSKMTFNEFIIPNNFDVNVAFESMNNRGKRLSTLELLKNRLLYLITLYKDDNENSKHDIIQATKDINDAWSNIYEQLGRNKETNLLDDDYLKTHWIIYWKYTRKTGTDYITFLLNKKFVRNNVFRALKDDETVQSDFDYFEDDNIDVENSGQNDIGDGLTLQIIEEYVDSLKSCVTYWVDSHYPQKKYPDNIKKQLDKLNLIGLRYFRPLVTVILKKYTEKIIEESNVVEILKNIERFIFVSFFINFMPKNYRDSFYYDCSRKLYYGEITIDEINQFLLTDLQNDSFSQGKIVKTEQWERKIKDYFTRGNKNGFYSWIGLQYLLFQYEIFLLEQQKRPLTLNPKELFMYKNDKKISIEHIYPQTDTDIYWIDRFGTKTDFEKVVYKGSLGNLLLLSMRINAQLQNDSFDEKKNEKKDEKENVLRTGYSKGTQSEIEVANVKSGEWTSKEIEQRSDTLINFIEKHWDIQFPEDIKNLSINPIQLFSGSV